jgi:hypothetical protein
MELVPSRQQPERVAQPSEIAEIYRALRRGREEKKDAPGAADFYYGEMEMRRHGDRGAKGSSGATQTRGERVLLTLYWLVSGYGLRASRALASLLLTVLAGAYLLDHYGFREGAAPDQSALLFSLESTISRLRAPEAELTNFGDAVSIALRLLGPLFFGLTIFALRGRLRR